MVGRRRLGKVKRWLARNVLAPAGVAVETLGAVRTRARIASFQQRGAVARRFPEALAEQPGPRVLAVVTHLTDESRPSALFVERLQGTLDGLLESLGHTRLELVLNTISGRHVAAVLPDYLSSRLVVRERLDVEPMFLGFEAQEEFFSRADEFDWFLYLEDDLLLSDGLVLEKLAYFNAGAPREALLLPHRYEFWEGRKIYIDLVSKASLDWNWNRLTLLEIDDWKFAEFDNPHSGCYCLSRPQLHRWLESGRQWYGRVSFTAARESAATGCLAESFRLYKPHPANISFLAIRHWGSKYAELSAQIHGLEGGNGT